MNLFEQETCPAQPSYRTIPLTKGYSALVDDSDYEAASKLKWHAIEARRPDGSIKTVYAYHAGGKEGSFYLHRFLLGVTDFAVKVDHEDHDGLNCRRYNIRKADNRQNGQNRRRDYDNKSGYKGISWSKQNKKWRTLIRINGVSKHIAYSDDPIEAAKKYDAAALEAFGQFAHLNFPASS